MATPNLLSGTPWQIPALRTDIHPVPEPSHIQVDGEAAESIISEKRIGQRIKHLRLKKSMGLVELGRHTGLSASFLSQLETGRVVPTLRNLARIAMVFSKDLNYFFEPEPQTLFRLHRGKDRVRLPQSGVQDPSYYFESLGYMVPDRQLDPYFAEFVPLKAAPESNSKTGAKADPKADPKPEQEPRSHQHFGCEFLFLLSGALDLRHGSATHHIEPGDAVYFDASTVHSYACSGDEPAAAIIVTLQQPIASPNGNGVRPSAATSFSSTRPASLPASGPASNGLRPQSTSTISERAG